MQRSHRSQLLAPLLLSALILAAAPASATPVTLYANGATTFGFDPDDVDAAIAAGEAPPMVVTGLSGGSGLSVTTPNGIPGSLGTSKADPSTGTSTWTVNNVSLAESFEDLVLVILGHDPSDPLGGFYDTENVGLEIDTSDPRWFLIQPDGFPDVTYLAYRLQDPSLAPGESTTVQIEYRVGQALFPMGDEFIFPRYAIAFTSVPVPEPSLLALWIAAGVVGLAARRLR